MDKRGKTGAKQLQTGQDPQTPSPSESLSSLDHIIETNFQSLRSKHFDSLSSKFQIITECSFPHLFNRLQYLYSRQRAQTL